MTAIRLTVTAPLLCLLIALPAVAAETPAEKELEAAAFAASQSQSQEGEEESVVEKMEQDDAKDQGGAATQAPAKSEEAPSK
jgi:hypothetical protein